MRTTLGFNGVTYSKHVLCPNELCQTMHTFSHAVEHKVCGATLKDGRACGSVLVKLSRSWNKPVLKPKIVVPILSIKKHLQDILQIPGFVELCRPSRGVDPNEDGYLDGLWTAAKWQSLRVDENKQPLLDEDNTFALLMYADGFQTTKFTTRNVGGVTLCIGNLNLHHRMRTEFLLPYTLVPGDLSIQNINSVLTPLVNELKEFTLGVTMKDHNGNDIKVCCSYR